MCGPWRQGVFIGQTMRKEGTQRTGLQEDKASLLLGQLLITNCFGRALTKPENNRGFWAQTGRLPAKYDNEMKRRFARRLVGRFVLLRLVVNQIAQHTDQH